MAELVPPIVRVSHTKRSAMMRRGAWSQIVTVAELPGWRAFYAKLAQKGPVQAAAYVPWLPVLDAAIAQVKA